jgi:hypothetical protein
MSRQEFEQHVDNMKAGLLLSFDQRQSGKKEEADNLIYKKAEESLVALEEWDAWTFLELGR